MKRIFMAALAMLSLAVVVYAAEKPPAPPAGPNAARIAELQSLHDQCVAEIERLTVMKYQLEGGMAELTRLDRLAAEAAKKAAEKPPEPKK